MAGDDVPMWFARLAGVAWRFVVVMVAVAVLVAIVVGFGSVVLPLFLGLLFTSALMPIHVALRTKGVAPALASLAALVVLAILIGLVAWTTIRAVADEWGSINAAIDVGVDRLVESATDGGVDDATAQHIADELTTGIGTLADVLIRGAAQVLPVVVSGTATVLLSLVVAFFFMKDGTSIWRWVVQLTGASGELVDRIGHRIWRAVSGYIIGQTAIAAIDATLIFGGALVLGVPHAGAIALITFLGAYVPYIGALLAGALAVLLAVAEGGVSRGAAMLVVVVAVQAFEGNVLQPWIQGRAVRIHPLVVALSVVAGGAIAGFLGVFLAVPVAASLLVTLDELRRAGILGTTPTESAADGEDEIVRN